MKNQYKNLFILAFCQMIFVGTVSLLVSLNSLIGHQLIENKALATLPVSTVIIGTLLAIWPAGWITKRFNRQLGLTIGSLLAITGGITCAFALMNSHFWLFTFGTMTIGMYNAFALLYRFTGADLVEDRHKGVAISVVLSGGILGGTFGPLVGYWLKDATTTPFMGSFLAVSGMGLLAIIALSQFKQKTETTREEATGPSRPIKEILFQPIAIAALFTGVIGYGIMGFLMAGSPVVMHHHHHHDLFQSAIAMSGHFLCMYLPSPLSGYLIARFGVLKIILIGLAIYTVCIAVGLMGTGILNFWVALSLLGLGWNFLFIGATTLMSQVYTASEKAKIQSLNDFTIMGAVGISEFASGYIIHQFGWSWILFSSLPFILLIALMVVRLQRLNIKEGSAKESLQKLVIS